jgi:protoheme IX farnesyltransferase
MVIGSACVFNNYIDRGIDRLMARTKSRALVTEAIPARRALIFASILGVGGFIVLAWFTHWLVVLIGLLAFIDYVIVYGISKRASVHGTIVGSLSGAAPILAGYVAVSNRVDTPAIILFIIMVLWQMPHFYAIAMYRAKDYAAASIPVLPVIHGLRAAKIQIIIYIIAYCVAVACLTLVGAAGYVYLGITLTAGVLWLGYGLVSLRRTESIRWARQMFFGSLLAGVLLSAGVAVGTILP